MNININVETKVSPDLIAQETFALRQGMHETLMRQVIQLQEDGVRDALIKLGWTPPMQQTCNCRWEGETQVQQCTLHQAHIEAIHEWAERAKAAEAKLKQSADEPVAVVSGYYGGQCVVLPFKPSQLFKSGTAFYARPRPAAWVGLEKRDMPDGKDPMYDHEYFIKGMVWADTVLREKNGGAA